ncbi:hypothetical protein LT85_4188 [Collimonas arenae]|uniref:Transmembrane protein n=1 Tax=Collimonas arenae TaxID=279058 RepID=A0A0A1FFR0_9BURK|nr:hypothetical protein [Collimonas arenae]AIY43346.1 hypothetical protein LT85_4188 [Collimonas arenae]
MKTRQGVVSDDAAKDKLAAPNAAPGTPDKTVKKNSHIKKHRDAVVNPRFTGFGGQLIQTHRALRRLAFPHSRWIDVLLVPALIFSCTLLAWPLIAELWSGIIRFWANGLGNGMLLRAEHTSFPGIQSVPYAHVEAALPDPLQWWAGMLVSITLLLATTLLPMRMLPITYALRVVGLVQLASQLYFYFWAAEFPYQSASSISALTQVSMVLILLTPWIYGLLYNIFDFGIPRKILLSLLAVLYLILLTPFQYTFAAWLMLRYSLLWHPLIYLLGSSLIQFGALVGFYSWAMSWQRRE